MKPYIAIILIVALVLNLIMGCTTSELTSERTYDRKTTSPSEKKRLTIDFVSKGSVKITYDSEMYDGVETIKQKTYSNHSYSLTPAFSAFLLFTPLGIWGFSEWQKDTSKSGWLLLGLTGGLLGLIGLTGTISEGFVKSVYAGSSTKESVIEKKQEFARANHIANSWIDVSFQNRIGSYLSSSESKQTNYDGEIEVVLPLTEIMGKLKIGETLVANAKAHENPDVKTEFDISYEELKSAYEKIAPPNLIASADYDDADSYLANKIIDATENAKLKVTIENKGNGIGYDVKLAATSDQPFVSLLFNEKELGDIRPREKKEVIIPLNADAKLPSATATFTVTAREKNKFDAKPLKIRITTAKLERPELKITNIEINDKTVGFAVGNGNGILETGETIELITYVKNEGVGKAIDTKLELISVSHGIEQVQASEQLGDIPVGKTEKGKVVVSIPRTYTSNKMEYKLRVSEVRSVGTVEKSETKEVRKQQALLTFSFEAPIKPLANNSTASVQITPENKGKLSAKNVRIKVSSLTSNVDLSNTNFSVGTIEPNASANPKSIDISLPRTFSEKAISLDIELTQEDFPPSRDRKTLPVTLLKPELKLNAVQNQTIVQGAQSQLELSVSNVGTLDAENVSIIVKNEKVNFTDEKTKLVGKLSVGSTSDAWRLPFVVPRRVSSGPLPIIVEVKEKDFTIPSTTLNYEIVEEAAAVTTIEGKKQENAPTLLPTTTEKPIISVSSHTDKQTVLSRSVDFTASASAEHGIQNVTAKVNGLKVYDSQTDKTVQEKLRTTKGKLLNLEFRIPDLQQGENNVEIVAYDNGNESTTKTLTLLYSPEKRITSSKLDPSIDVENVDKIRTGKKNPNGVAVVIGIEKYETLPPALYADRDAEAMKEYLVKTFGYSEDNIVLLTNENATFTKTRAALLGKTLESKMKEGESDVFIFYSGHGLPNVQNKKPYLAPYDCDKGEIQFTAISMSDVFEKLRSLKAKSVTVVIDACFSGQPKGKSQEFLFAAKPILLVLESPELLLTNGTTIYSSSGEEMSSWIQDAKHSIMTYYFLKGLQGEADGNDNKEITIEEIEKYLTKEVPSEAKRQKLQQTPQVKAIDKSRVLVKY